MQAGNALVSLVAVAMFNVVVKTELPQAVSSLPPFPVDVTLLLTLSLLDFRLVSEVRVEFQLEMKAYRLLCKVCEVELLVHTLSHVTRDPQLDRLLRNLFHLSATLIL